MDQKIEDQDLDFIKIQYQVLSSTQLNHSTLVWNAITTLFVAQAFLWAISLDNTISIVIRCFVSFISTLISFASFQNFIRNRWMETADCIQLEAIERLMLEKQNCPAMIVHHQLSNRTLMSTENKNGENLEVHLKEKKPNYKKSFIAKKKTFKIWRFVLGVVMLFTACLFCYNVCLAIRVDLWSILIRCVYAP